MAFLERGLALVEQGGLGEMLGEFLGFGPYLVAFGRLGKRDETGRTRLERATAAQRIGLVRDTPSMDGLPVHSVTLVVVYRRQRRVDGNLVEVGPAQPADLGIHVGMDASGQQRIVGEVDAGDHMRGAERHLLGLGEEVVRIAV